MLFSRIRVLYKEAREGFFISFITFYPACLPAGKFTLTYMSKLTEYIKETKGELKHVIWPSKNQTFYYTLIVVVLSIIVAYYLGIFDYIFGQGLQRLIS